MQHLKIFCVLIICFLCLQQGKTFDIGDTLREQLNVICTKFIQMGGPLEDIKNYPIGEFRLHLSDIHFYSGDLNTQYIAHHYCNDHKNGFQMCLLFDDNDRSRVIGVEYVISKEIFDSLPEEEKPLWHSHVYEVKSGLLVAPDLSPDEEWKVMEWLVGTYGKVIDNYRQGFDLPLGAPRLANALAQDSQVDWEVADLQDKRLKLPTTHKQRRAAREGLKVPPKAAGADQYLETGKAPQFKVFYQDMGKKNANILNKHQGHPSESSSEL